MWNEEKREECFNLPLDFCGSDQNNMGRKRFISAYTPREQFNSKGILELGAEIIKEGCLLAGWLLWLWFVFSQTSFTTQKYLPSGGTAHSGLNASTSSTARTIPQCHGHRPIWSETLSSEMTLRCVKWR